MFHPDMTYQMARNEHSARIAAAERHRQVREARAAAHEHRESRLLSLVKGLRQRRQNAEQPLVTVQPTLANSAAH